MNIIANNCIGGYIYKELGLLYENPFIWMNLKPEDLITIINTYNNIDFKKYNITYERTIWNPLLPKNTLVPTIHIDESINIYCTHHLYSENFGNQVVYMKNGKRFISNNMSHIVKERYDRLVKRMYKLNKINEPIFIFLEWDPYKRIDEIINVKTAGKKIIITSLYETRKTNNIEIFNFNDIKSGAKHIDTLLAAKYLINNSEIILNAAKINI